MAIAVSAQCARAVNRRLDVATGVRGNLAEMLWAPAGAANAHSSVILA
ncbi:hypothetical protein PATSB16_12910 [Pandoraea thiooxydans]|nr:hypothetical protein PATSB16_12910 [Pandoraea thiooxydans]